MEALDLRMGPPRLPRAEAGEIVFLPRTIDKLRATLPGGNLGEYTITGISHEMCDQLGIDAEGLTHAVAGATSDDDVVAYVRAHARPGAIDAWNAYIRAREVFKGDRAAAVARFPWLADRPDLKLSLDMLAADDGRMFAGADTRR